MITLSLTKFIAMVDSVRAPPIKKGWMTKQGRGGLVKNWKKRYFVLMAGKIFYYVNETKEYPYGEALKGEMNLVNTELEPLDHQSPCQIFVTSFNGEHNLLMQTATPEESNEWRASLKEHIRFANSSTEETVSRFSRRLTVSSEVGGGGDTSPAPTGRKTAPASTSDTVETSANEGEEASKGQSPEEAASSLFDTAVYFFTNNAKRSEYLALVQPRLQSIKTALMTNLLEGEPGTRGEQLLGAAAALVAIIFIGFVPPLVLIISVFMRLFSTVLIASGLAMLGNAVWELGDKASLLVCPPPKLSAFVKTGVYGIVRHPMYGGIILLCFGWAMLQQHTYRVFFAIALSVVLNKCAELEEEALEKAFPKEYPTYASQRKALIPFLY